MSSVMADAVSRRKRATRMVNSLCSTAKSTRELLEGVSAIVRAAILADGAFLCTTDPISVVFNAEAVVYALPDAMRTPWMRNEFLETDLNKFGGMHRSRTAAVSLEEVSRSLGRPSTRDGEINRRFGFGPELRAVFSQGDACWGVANFLRVIGAPEFSEAERAWLAGLTVPVANGLRRVVLEHTLLGPDTTSPGIIVLDTQGRVISRSQNAQALIDDLWIAPLDGGPDEALPCQAVAVASVARARATGVPDSLESVTRVQGRAGHWLSLRSTHAVTEEGELAHIVVTIEPASPDDIMAMIAVAYGLTRREQEVFAELRRGDSLQETAARLFISHHTLRTHVRSLFAKTGCSSRGELVSRLFIHRSGDLATEGFAIAAHEHSEAG